MKIIIDGNKFQDKLDLHRYLAKKLGFPDYYGENLDALYDVLGDIDFELTVDFKNMENFAGFVETFKDAQEINKLIKFE